MIRNLLIKWVERQLKALGIIEVRPCFKCGEKLFFIRTRTRGYIPVEMGLVHHDCKAEPGKKPGDYKRRGK
jgi:hypothetical protein